MQHHNNCQCRKCKPRETLNIRRDRLVRIVILGIKLGLADHVYKSAKELASIGNDYLSLSEN